MEPLNVLVVVDVQNCFMFSSDEKNKNFLNLADKNDSQAIANEIAELTTGKDIVVFTRDYHPMNHISFEKDEGRKIVLGDPRVWPRHCRNQFRKCKSRNDAKETIEPDKTAPTYDKNDDLIATINLKLRQNALNPITTIKGTDLSYFFYFTSLASVVNTLTSENKNGVHKIGLAINNDGNASATEIDNEQVVEVDPTKRITVGDIAWKNVNPFIGPRGTKFVTLTKGEDCSRESYSAFNYHIDYDITNPADPKFTDFESIQEKNSTGLWEWILKQNNGASRKIIITVCGLVGNVCVMHTVLQGITMWEQLYKNDNPGVTVEFVLSLKGTRFTSVLPPAIVNPNASHQLTRKEGSIFPQSMSYIDWMSSQLPKFKDNEMKPYPFPDFSIAFPDGQTASSAKLLEMNKPAQAAKGGKRTRRMRMRKTRKQHKKQCKCTSCACNKRKSRRRTKRSYRRR